MARHSIQALVEDEVLPPFRSLPLAHRERRRIQRSLGGEQFRRIERAPEGKLGACRSTVARKVASQGGEMVCGWLGHIWPNLFIEVLFHCVWRSPQGRLVDLTVPYPTDPATHSTFALAPGASPDTDPPSRYWLLTKAPEVTDLLALVAREIEVRRRTERAVSRRVGRLPLGVPLLDRATAAELADVHELERGIASAVAACRSLSRRPDF
jgi:hypothetical protein